MIKITQCVECRKEIEKGDPCLCEECFEKEEEAMKEIWPKFMLGTTAYHKLGNLSDEEGALFIAHKENKKYYQGQWTQDSGVTSYGFFGILFPKNKCKEIPEPPKEKLIVKTRNSTYILEREKQGKREVKRKEKPLSFSICKVKTLIKGTKMLLEHEHGVWKTTTVLEIQTTE